MLVVHRSSRADLLAERLAEVLAAPPEDPFAPDLVAVPTRGVERWLSQRLSVVLGASAGLTAAGTPERGDGVCANVEFPFPAALVGSALAAATGLDPEADPWAPDRAVWPLLEVVEACLDDPWLGVVAAHLGHRRGGGPDPARRSRRWSTVRHLADLYDRYGVHRPALVRAWAAGQDVDAEGRPLPDDLAWQAPLWRELRLRIGVPSPSERLEAACARLREEPELVALPERISLFGLTRLSPSYLAVAAALAEHRQVHLWLLHPSEVQWSRLAAELDPATAVGPRRRSAHGHGTGDEGSAGYRSGHPILATWGRDAREMQAVVMATLARTLPTSARGDGDADGHRRAGPVRTTAERTTAERATAEEDVILVPSHPSTLLGRLQAAIRADQTPPERDGGDRAGEALPRLDPADRSLQVHSCHGRTRQVEVLRDVVLGLLDDDPTLEPRDVVVLCPDIDVFAPLVQAAFGPGQAVAGQDLHVRLADRSLRQTNPVLSAVGQLLELAAGRFTASAVLDFAAAAPVRRRFRFDDDDLSRLEEWVRTSGVRWGLDTAHRASYQLGSLGAGTWDAGLDRLLLGVAMSEDDLRRFGGVLPLDDVGSGEIERAGRLAELVDRLGVAAQALSGTHPLQEWLERLAQAADDLTAPGPAEAWQRGELQAALAELARDAAPGGRPAGPADLTLGEVRSLLAHRLQGRPTRANFRTGHLTVCTMVPMRSVPHRVVCLLGLDDGAFPRHPATDGDDLLERDPWVGDRDARSEDRQLLLDALLAAGEHLVVTYSGRSERTNIAQPPSVPVGELLDAVDGMARAPNGGPARDSVLVEHPLQRWDPRNFVPGALGGPGPASFDRVALGGAQVSTRPRVPAATLATTVLARQHPELIELEDLVRFVQHPVGAFLRQRLGVRVPDRTEVLADALPPVLQPLDRWTVGDRVLHARMAGISQSACREAELARGELPPLRLGQAALDSLLREVEALVRTAGWAGRPLQALDVVVDLGGQSLVGTVSEVDDDTVSSVTYSRLAPKHRLAAWVRLLALSAARPERPWRARSIGMGERRSVATRTLRPLGEEAPSRAASARRHLADLVDLFDRGRAEPLPLFCRTSEAWAAAVARAAAPAEPARLVWTTSPGSAVPGEDDDAAHRLAFAGRRPFEELRETRPRADESGPGWAEDEESRLGRLARRLWDPLLAQEDPR